MFCFDDLYFYFWPVLCWPFCSIDLSYVHLCSVDLFILLTFFCSVDLCCVDFFVLLTSAMITFFGMNLLLFSPMWSSSISFPINLRTAWILLKILLLFYFMLLSESLFSLEPLLLLMCRQIWFYSMLLREFLLINWYTYPFATVVKAGY